MENALVVQANFWRLVGILTVLVMALYALVMIVGAVIAILAAVKA
jgi:hypothetical protein